MTTHGSPLDDPEKLYASLNDTALLRRWRTAPALEDTPLSEFSDAHVAMRRELSRRGALPDLESDRIRASLAVIKALEQASQTWPELRALQSPALRERDEAIAHHAGVAVRSMTISTRWGCGYGPLETCVYNSVEDPLHDECLYCHLPLERK